MKNQFFYTRKVVNTDESVKLYKDSFNVNKVIRTVEIEDGSLLVLLDDGHEESKDVPDIDPKTGKYKGKKRERNFYSTEITLTEKEDIEKFYNTTAI